MSAQQLARLPPVAAMLTLVANSADEESSLVREMILWVR